MSRKQISIVAILAVLNLLVFCGGSAVLFGGFLPSAPKPVPATALSALAPLPVGTPTLAQPGSTPTPAATATLVNAPLPSNPASPALLAAMAKSKTATSYHLQLDMTMQGDLGQLAPAGSGNGEIVMFSMTGDVNGKDSHLTMKGMIGVLLSGDADKGMELIDSGGKSYVHGPMPLLGAKENKWYVLPAQQAASSKPAIQPDVFYNTLGGKSLDLSKLSVSGTETLDGKRCDVYSADKTTAMNAFLSIGPETQLKSSDLATLQAGLTDAEFKLWICDDGFLHQFRIGFQAIDNQHGGKTVGIKMFMHLWDFGSAIKITAPAGAVPATVPFVQTLTPAPKKK